jgi:protoporphyrinogen oxidase
VTTNGKRWGILGGGILGMTLALRLRQAGHEVVLCEAADELGGLASAWNLGGVTWDKHYHVILLSDAHLRGLLAELDLEQDTVWNETRTGFYTDGKLYSMSNTLEFLRFPPLGLWDKLRLGATIFYAARIKNWKKLESIPVSAWLTRWSGERTFEKIWQPLLRAKLGENHRKASAAFIWAIIARMYAARRTGLKKEMFGYVKGGYARILQHFGHKLEIEGVDLRLKHAVEHVESEGGQVQVAFRNSRSETFDRVVLTTPAPVAARLVPALNDEEKTRLHGIQYQGIICASLLLKQPLAGYYVTNITDEAPFTAVIETSALVQRGEFNGSCLVYLPKYVVPDDPAFALSDEEIREQFLAALERMYPHFRRDDVLAFRVSRVRHVLAISTLNYSEKLPPMITSVPGVSIVNSAHIINGTLNVNETIQLAERAATRLLEREPEARSEGVSPPALCASGWQTR